MALYYGDDPEYDVQVYDSVAIVIESHDIKFPAMVTKIHPKSRELTVCFEGIDRVLDRIILRKSARVPFASVEFVGRAW